MNIKVDAEMVVKGIGTMTTIVVGAKGLKDAYYELFDIKKENVNERKEEQKHINDEKAKERGRERRIYELIKENCQEVDLKEKRHIYDNLDLLIIPLVPAYAGYKVLAEGYKHVRYDLIIKGKYKEFKRVFNECGLKEKMMNDVNYIPNQDEIENIQRLYKLETGVELIDVLQIVFRNK